MYQLYISVAIETEIFILPANQMMIPDQFVVFWRFLV